MEDRRGRRSSCHTVSSNLMARRKAAAPQADPPIEVEPLKALVYTATFAYFSYVADALQMGVPMQCVSYLLSFASVVGASQHGLGLVGLVLGHLAWAKYPISL